MKKTEMKKKVESMKPIPETIIIGGSKYRLHAKGTKRQVEKSKKAIDWFNDDMRKRIRFINKSYKAISNKDYIENYSHPNSLDVKYRVKQFGDVYALYINHLKDGKETAKNN